MLLKVYVFLYRRKYYPKLFVRRYPPVRIVKKRLKKGRPIVHTCVRILFKNKHEVPLNKTENCTSDKSSDVMRCTLLY